MKKLIIISIIALLSITGNIYTCYKIKELKEDKVYLKEIIMKNQAAHIVTVKELKKCKDESR